MKMRAPCPTLSKNVMMGTAEHELSLGPLRGPTVTAQVSLPGILPSRLGWEMALHLVVTGDPGPAGPGF